jgi:porphobilinogen synthase
LIAPLFVKEGIIDPSPIPSMPGHAQHTLESLRKEARDLASRQITSFVLFGVPERKDAEGSEAWNPDGIAQRALRSLREELGPDHVLMADLCLDEYTDHGHCGLLGADGSVDNDRTLEVFRRIALAQAEAGADLVAPSGMMDGQVGAIRSALDRGGFERTGIQAYAAKFASAFYGPFREAAECAPKFGDRAGYQMDPANSDEALREVRADIEEGADIVMVKPAMAYLDVLRAVAEVADVPVAAYQVSGEYAMVEAAAANGWIERDRTVLETLTAIRRAGADIVLTYWATEVAGRLT